jgi:hypothetical protein
LAPCSAHGSECLPVPVILLYWHDQRFTGCDALRTLVHPELVHGPMLRVTKAVLVHVHHVSSLFLYETGSKKRLDGRQEAEEMKLDVMVSKFGQYSDFCYFPTHQTVTNTSSGTGVTRYRWKKLVQIHAVLRVT